MNKKILLLIALLILLSSGLYFSYETFNGPLSIKEIKDSPFSILLKNEKETFTENTDWYEAKIEYPKQNQKVRDQILKMWADFATETEIKKYTNLADAKQGLQINVEGLRYSFIAEYKIATSTSNTISYVYTIYNFTGGAHGSANIIAITEDEKQEIVSVEKILQLASLAKIAKLAEADLKKQKFQRLKESGMPEKEILAMQKNDTFLAEGVKPTRENYSVAWYEGDDIVISFGQYQVASYAEGMFEVRIPKNQI